MPYTPETWAKAKAKVGSGYPQYKKYKQMTTGKGFTPKPIGKYLKTTTTKVSPAPRPASKRKGTQRATGMGRRRIRRRYGS